jgi:hypothetical protein
MLFADSSGSQTPIMHIAFHILEFWALAFVSLGATLVLLNFFWNVIEQDLCLKTLGKEAIIAGVASLIEAVGLWLIITFVNSPSGMRGMIIPALMVGLIYKVAHFEDWSRVEVLCLLIFQLLIATIGAALLTADFAMAFTVLIVFGIALGVVAIFIRGF